VIAGATPFREFLVIEKSLHLFNYVEGPAPGEPQPLWQKESEVKL